MNVSLNSINWKEFDSILESGTKQELNQFLKKHHLEIVDNKIVAKNQVDLQESIEYWDKRQTIKKLNLNSTYGALLNPGCRFFDKRLGQSTTLSGRQIVKHMSSKTNEIITGKYDHLGESIIYGDTDSVDSTSMIRTTVGDMTIEKLFDAGYTFWTDGEKEYSVNRDIKIAHYSDRSVSDVNYNYCYRHKVSKKRFRIKTADGKEVIVTEDHSVMVMTDDGLVEKKPVDLSPGDKAITLQLFKRIKMNYRITEIEEIEQLSDFNDEYVYDIGVDSNDPFFFANDILVHNSCYFSAYPTMKSDITNGTIKWSKDLAIRLYDQIGEEVNDSFPDFMKSHFNCPKNRGSVIKSGREIVASSGLFITKKRYAVLYYDKEGKRCDQNGIGQIKAMGLDLKRADTPKYVQQFLYDILTMVLTEVDESAILSFIKEFRQEFRNKKSWEKGTPKRVNKLTDYKNRLEREKTDTPGHVTASLNWNFLKKIYNDHYALPITDGSKVIVCKLLDNPIGFTSVAYPVTEKRLPEWFMELPFNDALMEETLIDKKLDNLIGVLDMDLKSAEENTTFGDLFAFE